MQLMQNTGFEAPPKTIVRSTPKDTTISAVEYRKADVDMLPMVVDVSRRALADGCARVAPIDSAQWWAEAHATVTRNDRHVVLAIVDGRAIGWCALGLMPCNHAPTVRLATMFSLWVDPAYRGRGIGSRLESMGETWARDFGARYFIASVLTKPPLAASPVPNKSTTKKAVRKSREPRPVDDQTLGLRFVERRGYAPLEAKFIKELV